MAVNNDRSKVTESEPESGSKIKALRLMIVGGAAVSLAGIVAAAAGSNTLGGGATLAGWLALVYGIHRFGRAG